MDENKVSVSKEPWFAVNLSMFFAGIGQIYSGRRLRGYILIFGQLALMCLGGWLLLKPTGKILTGASLLFAAGIMHIWNLFDAYKCARRTNTEDFESSRKKNEDAWLAVFLSQLLPGLGHMYIKKWFLGIILVASWIALSSIEDAHSLFLILGTIFLVLVCYHAYISSPFHRETSKKLIMILVIVIFVGGLTDNYWPDFMGIGVKTFRMPGSGMEPTVRVGDRILVKKSVKYVPHRGDVIIFKHSEDPSRYFIKRVVAFGGETVEIRDNGIYVDGNRLKDYPFYNIQYISIGEFGVEGKPFLIPDHSLFLLGDNSRNSRDSRFFGSVPEANVSGRAYKIYWPLDDAGPIE